MMSHDAGYAGKADSVATFLLGLCYGTALWCNRIAHQNARRESQMYLLDSKLLSPQAVRIGNGVGATRVKSAKYRFEKIGKVQQNLAMQLKF
jgi:hypothetical protein